MYLMRYHLKIALPNLSWQPRLMLLLLTALLAACQSSPPVVSEHRMVTAEQSNHLTTMDESQIVQRLNQQHTIWHGTPYQLGGQSHKGIDCSGFVQLTYRDLFGIALPRTTASQQHAGQKIRKSQLKAGDLVFFRNGRHVGIYLKNNQFLHASTSQGVMISNLYNAYWSRQYSQAISVRK